MSASNVDIDARSQFSASGVRQVVWSSVVGTTVEWYDFLAYGTASALIFNKLFFPSLSPAAGTVAAFGTYGVGFVARPLGGLLFGHFGDRIGRKAMLALTLLIMGFGTFLIGCMPTFRQVGMLAPIGLIVLRILQGIGMGGEWGGAVLMVIESVPNKRRGYFGSLVQLGYPLGVIASAGMFALVAKLPEAELMRWGWRVPFLLSAVLVAVGLFIRLRLAETPAFRAVLARRQVAKVPVLELLARHRRTVLIATALKLSEIAFITVATIWSISYVTGKLAMPRSAILNGVVIASVIELFTLPAFGWLSDRFGRKPLYIAGCLISMLFAFPMFWLFDTRQPALIAATVAIAVSFGQGIMFGPEAAWVAELFPSRLRYSGASFGFQIGAVFGGGLTPIVAASLLAWKHATWPISVYLMVLAVITLSAAAVAPETAGKELT